MLLRTKGQRPGAIVPLTAVCMIVLLSFVALALDMGLLMIARNQCQNTADAAAMAGARTLTGDQTTNNNYNNVAPNAQAVAAGNKVLGTSVNPATQLALTIGSYYYDTSTASFKMNPTGRPAGENWTLVQATVTANPPTAFAQVLGMGTFNARARATAAHRPRDAVIVVDFSGSMRFESMLASPHAGARTASMNPDTVYPTWGHYDGNANVLKYSADVQLSSGEVIGDSNIGVPTASALDAVLGKFYADTTAFGTTTVAFTKASDSYASTPAGDVPLKANKGSGSAYAKMVSEHVYNNTTSTGRDWRFELDGYSAYKTGAANATTSAAADYTGVPFYGYTQGPGYWGKTFMSWPPDPRIPLTTTYYSATQIKDIVHQFLHDFGYTEADYNNASVVTTLSGSNISATATSITVASATNFPAAPFYIMVGTASGSGATRSFTAPVEIMRVTSATGTTWTVQRARHGTTGTAFTTGKQVGLLTGLPLHGIYTAANTAVPAPGGTSPDSNLWTAWPDATALGNYLTANVYLPGSKTKLTAADDEYLQLLRLLNRNFPNKGMSQNSSNVTVPADWRARFFLTTGGSPLMDSTMLYDSTGNLRVPRDSSVNNYRINYAAILDWIKSGPNPFPNQLRAGGIVYYTAIPSTINTSTFPPSDPNQRFWKEYIDEVLGVQQTGGSGSTPEYIDTGANSGYGDDFQWGTTTLAVTGLPSVGLPTSTYMGYTDNPKRPKLRGWFGPLSLVDFIGNYNAYDLSNNWGPRLWWPGTVPETPTYQTKLAIQAALKDMMQNHPNDNVAMVYFSSPKNSATATGYYNMARYPMGRDSRLAINALWFSPKVITTNQEISVYGPSGVNNGDIYDVPRANGGTCYSMGLMLAHNQFSGNTALVDYTKNALPGTAGGLGRNGASKMLIFETDGCVNTGASATYVTSSTGKGYYQVRLADANNPSAGGSEYPTGVGGVTFATGQTQSQNLATQMCADQSAGGFSTPRRPVKIHCIAFGSLFEATNSSTSKTNALSLLASLEAIGKVNTTGATTLPTNKIVTGNYNTRINKLQAAFSNIMQDGVQVSLLSSGPGEP